MASKPQARASKSTPRQSSARTAKPLPEVPDKLYYRIGEVARLCGVETYVLRFWETEFPQLKPNKSGAGQRLYRRREVDLARRIRTLLYEDGYTIPGARQAIAEANKAGADAGKVSQPATENAQLPLARAGLKTGPQTPRLGKLRLELKEILGLLSSAPGANLPRSVRRSPSSGPSREADGPELFD